MTWAIKILGAFVFFAIAISAVAQPFSDKRRQRKIRVESRKLLALGHRLYQQKQWDAAIDCGHRVIELDSSNVAGYYFLSDAYSIKFDAVRALNILRIAERRFPNEKYLLLRSAQLWLSLSVSQEALAYYEKSELAQPYNPVVYFGKSVALYQLNRKEESLIAIDKGLTLTAFPNPYVLWFKGVLLYEKEEYQDALTWFQKLSNVQANDATVNFYIGMCYYKEGSRLKRAKKYLIRAQKKGVQIDESVKRDLVI